MADDSLRMTQIARRLLDSMISEDDLDEELFNKFEQMVEAHSLYAQLLSVGIIIQMMQHVPDYIDTMNEVACALEEDLSEMSPEQKIRAMSTFGSSVRGMLDAVSNLHASKDASGALISSLRNLAGSSHVGEDDGVLSGLKEMSPRDRQLLLRGAISALKKAADTGDK